MAAMANAIAAKVPAGVGVLAQERASGRDDKLGSGFSDRSPRRRFFGSQGPSPVCGDRQSSTGSSARTERLREDGLYA